MIVWNLPRQIPSCYCRPFFELSMEETVFVAKRPTYLDKVAGKLLTADNVLLMPIRILWSLLFSSVVLFHISDAFNNALKEGVTLTVLRDSVTSKMVGDVCSV